MTVSAVHTDGKPLSDFPDRLIAEMDKENGDTPVAVRTEVSASMAQ